MQFTRLAIPDVVLITPKVFGDERGFFMETWRQSWAEELGIDGTFVQDNHSRSSRGILRGLHFQIKQPQGKLVRVTSGAVFDVAVDLRRSSPTFGRWVGEVLSADNHRMLWVPPGFAHGFYVLSDSADFVYKCTDYYAPEYERCLLWNDADVGIDWPLIDNQPPRLSAKDAQGRSLREIEVYP
jgi:dTDP-4-dehydrorhamnose 3,5-epimerase